MENGWITLIVDWLKTTFCPSPTRLVLLLLNGRKFHITYKIRHSAINNEVHILKFPPHTTNFLTVIDNDDIPVSQQSKYRFALFKK